MDFDIREIGATLLVGSFIFLVAEGLLSFVFRIDLTGFYQGEFFGFPGNLKAEQDAAGSEVDHGKREQKARRQATERNEGKIASRPKQYPIPFTVFLAISLVVGLIGEDLAMHIVEEQPEVVSAPASSLVRYVSPTGNFLGVRFDSLSSKHRARAARLVEIAATKKCDPKQNAALEKELSSGLIGPMITAASASEQKGDCIPESAKVSLTALGKSLFQLRTIQSICGAVQTLQKDGSNDAGSSSSVRQADVSTPPTWPALWQILSADGEATLQVTDRRWQKLVECLSATYYHAKNRNFLEPTMFEELRRIDIRRKLTGAFAFFALLFLLPAITVVSALSVWRLWQIADTRVLTAAAAANGLLLVSTFFTSKFEHYKNIESLQAALIGAIVAPFLIAVLAGLWRWIHAPKPDANATAHRKLAWLIFMSAVLMLAIRFAHIGVTRGLDTGTLVRSIFAFSNWFTPAIYLLASVVSAWLLWRGFERNEAWPRPQNSERSRIGSGLILIGTLIAVYVGGLHACAIESREFNGRVFGYYSTIGRYEETAGVGVPGDNPFGSERLQSTLEGIKARPNAAATCLGSATSHGPASLTECSPPTEPAKEPIAQISPDLPPKQEEANSGSASQ